MRELLAVKEHVFRFPQNLSRLDGVQENSRLRSPLRDHLISPKRQRREPMTTIIGSDERIKVVIVAVVESAVVVVSIFVLCIGLCPGFIFVCLCVC